MAAKSHMVVIKLDDELYTVLDEQAQRDNSSVAMVMRAILREHAQRKPQLSLADSVNQLRERFDLLEAEIECLLAVRRGELEKT